MGSLRSWIVRELEATGSTRACAVLRIIVMVAVIYKSMVVTHPVLVDVPIQRALGTVLLVCAPLALIGYKTRLTTALVALCWGYLHLRWGLIERDFVAHAVQSSQSAIYVAVLPSGKSLSVDRWLEVRRARAKGEIPPPEEGPLWGVWVAAISMSCLYFWAGIDKVDPDWFAGRRIDKLWLHNWGSSDSMARYPILVRIFSVGLAVGTTVLELTLAVGLLIPRVRKYMVFPGLALHLGIWVVLGVWPFTMLCIAAFIVTIPPKIVHDFFDTVMDLPREESSGADPPPESSGGDPAVTLPKMPRWLKGVVVVVFTAWCWQGPARESRADPEADPKANTKANPEPATWHWSLLSGKRAQRQTCDIRYYERVDGQDRYLNRLKVLGYAPDRLKKSGRHRPVSPRRVAGHTKLVCTKLLKARRGKPIDVRANIRCPSEEGWQQVEDMSRNVCEGVRLKKRKKRRKKKKQKQKGASDGTR